MARKDFKSMLSSIDDPETPGTATSSPTTSTQRAASSEARTRARGVGYDKLERKEVRLSEDQLAELTTLARRINKQRQGQGHCITENTLIRLGIDLLLQEAPNLEDTTETELAASLKLT